MPPDTFTHLLTQPPALVVICAACSPGGDTTQSNTAADSLAILDALDFIETRAAAGDIGFFDVYAEDAAIMLQDRWSDADRATAETFYRSILTSMPEVFRDNSREIHEIVVAGDWAFVRVTFRRPPTQSADGELVRDGSRHIMIWRRQLDGGWKLQRDIFINPPPAP